MSSFDNVRLLLAARAAFDPNAAELLELFTKADAISSESSLGQIGSAETPRLEQEPSGSLVVTSPSHSLTPFE